jgi:hypothetical protein
MGCRGAERREEAVECSVLPVTSSVQRWSWPELCRCRSNVGSRRGAERKRAVWAVYDLGRSWVGSGREREREREG